MNNQFGFGPYSSRYLAKRYTVKNQTFGMIQEETSETVKIYLPTGEQVVVRAADILKRDDAKNSGMPSSFIYTLSDKDVADLTAWIMTLQ